MRKIVVFNRISIDGAYARVDGNVDWFVQDPEVDKAVHESMRPDTILFGRVTYQMFEGFWPTVAGNPNFPKPAQRVAEELNEMTKMVFSKTLDGVGWQNSELVKGDLIDEVTKMKQGNGRDITVFGSGTIVQQLADEGLVDEYLLIVTPVVLEQGKPMLAGVKGHKLILLSARSFDSGNVLIHYKVDRD